MARVCPECDWLWPKPKGACPNCGSTAAPEISLQELDESGRARRKRNQSGKAKMPRSLMVLGIVFVIYLGWRIVQGVTWLLHYI